MRTALIAFLACAMAALLASPVLAQGRTPPSQDQLKKQRADKVAEAWFTDAGWNDDYDAVRAKAKEAQKLIFAYFSRTYST